jgi:hypothetical protein
LSLAVFLVSQLLSFQCGAIRAGISGVPLLASVSVGLMAPLLADFITIGA